MDASKSSHKDDPAALAGALSEAEATKELSPRGWGEFKFYNFGDEQLNYGRYPTAKFEPSASFSFLVCQKLS